MRSLLILLLAMTAFAGCMSDDAPAGNTTTSDGDGSGDDFISPMNETWYLHDIRAACDGDNPANHILTANLDEANDQDGCGQVGVSAAAAFTNTFTAQSNTTGFFNGTVDMSIFVGFAEPGPHTVTVALKAAGKTVFSDTLEQNYVGTGAVGNMEYSFSGPLTNFVPFDSKFSLDVTTTGGSYFMGYGSDSPSGFTVTPS